MLEAMAASVARRLDAEGLRHLVLKGPVTNRWLYGGPDKRAFGDIDLLVDPVRLRDADDVLVAMGFDNFHRHQLGVYRPQHESTWSRGSHVLDVHTRLAGVPARRAEEAFRLFYEARESLVLHGQQVWHLDEPARCLHLALHVAQSRRDERALNDLELGLHKGASAWQAAAELAQQIEAVPAFRHGLGRLPTGRTMLRHLSLEGGEPDLLVALRTGHEFPEALALAELLQLPARLRPRRFISLFQREGGRPAAVSTWRDVGVRAQAALRMPAALRLVLSVRRAHRREGTGAGAL